MNDPFHQCRVEVAGDHLRFLGTVVWTLVRIGGAGSREAEFLFQLPLDGNDGGRIDAQRQLEMQARRNFLQVLAESLHDGDRVARHRVIGRPGTQRNQGQHGK